VGIIAEITRGILLICHGFVVIVLVEPHHLSSELPLLERLFEVMLLVRKGEDGFSNPLGPNGSKAHNFHFLSEVSISTRRRPINLPLALACSRPILVATLIIFRADIGKRGLW
jgi:hypothetical protein